MLREALEGTKVTEEADAKDLAAWVNEHLKIEMAPDEDDSEETPGGGVSRAL